MRLAKFFLVSSVLVFAVGCQTIPPPKGLGCVAFPKKGRMVCFDLEKDFDRDGSPKKDAQPQFFRLTLDDIDKWVLFDPDSFANLKAYGLKHRDLCEKMAGNK